MIGQKTECFPQFVQFPCPGVLNFLVNILPRPASLSVSLGVRGCGWWEMMLDRSQTSNEDRFLSSRGVFMWTVLIVRMVKLYAFNQV